MNLTNTYFGFTNQKTPLQAGKIEKSLDLIVKRDDKIGSEKVNIYNLLKEGYSPDYEENYSYYSSKKQDYTKPKTLYKLSKVNSFYEINKTLYNYANYLLDNDFVNEDKANKFIQNEIKEQELQEKQEHDRLQFEREEAEKQRRQEEQERKERLQRKQSEWSKIGEQLLSNFENNPITEVLDYHWKEIKSIYVNEEKENFYISMSNKFTGILGNQGYCISWLQYYIDQENNSDECKTKYTIKINPLRKLEKDILFKAFNNVTLHDKNITIAAKVKAVFENREYKGGKVIKQYKFYYFHIDKETRLKEFKEAYGQKFIINGHTFFLRTIEEGKYSMIEAKTGIGLGGVFNSKSEAIKRAKGSVNKNKDRLDQIIKRTIEQHGRSPLYQDQKVI